MIAGRKKTVVALSILVSLSISRADMKLYFDRDNSTYNWLTAINYTMSGNRNMFRSYFDGQSNLIKGGYNRWQESASTGFDSKVSIRDRLALVFDGDYTVNGLDKRRVRTTEMGLGFSFNPAPNIRISPTLKAANKKRSELETQLDEKGMGYGLAGEITPTVFRGISLDGAFSYDRVNLSNIPRQQGDGTFKATGGLWVVDTVSVALRATEASKKYYSPAGDSEEITRQIKQERNAVFVLKTRLPARLRLAIDGGAHLSRYLYRQNPTDTSIKTQRDNYGRGGDYLVSLSGKISDMIALSFGYQWSSTSEDFKGIELDLKTDKGELSFRGNAALSLRDTLTADLAFGVTSYSNPNIGSIMENRDQKTILVNGGYSHLFNRYFQLGVTGGAVSFHQIYVSGARSANNGRNDTYILTPYAVWNPAANLSARQSFDIQANYITFDFDRKKIATKNRIFRRATSRTELTLKISERMQLIQAYQYRYEDYGLLIWDDGWQQSVSWDRRRHGLETRLVYNPMGQLRLTPYFWWEKTGDYHRSVDPGSDLFDPLEIRYLKDEQVKMFFDLEVAFSWSQSRKLTADFSHRLRKFMERPRETNNYIKISMEYLF